MSAEKVKVLKAKRLIDANGGEPIQNAVMVIEGELIKEVGSEGKVSVPAGAEVIDMGDCTLMPGLFDNHIHLGGFNDLQFRSPRARYERTPHVQQMSALLAAQVSMEMGFTTLRDGTTMTSYGHFNTKEMVAVRDAIKAGFAAGPRLVVGGRTVTHFSHLTLSYPPNLTLAPGEEATGPWELRKLARTRMRANVDYIKTCSSGGGGSDLDEPEEVNATMEELTAICEEAHMFNKQVACHCHNAEAEKRSVRAGVDTMEHCVLTDDEAIAMMLDANIPLTTTLWHRTDRDIEKSIARGDTAFTVNKKRRIQSLCWESFRKMHKAGMKLVLGTDIQGSGTGEDGSAVEMEIVVSLGMTPMEAIQTATKNAAEAIRLGKVTGTLDVGKFADVIAVNGDPLQDIKVFQNRDNIRMVIKEGKVYVDKRPGHEKYVVNDWNWKPL
ncbi:amidohydrolase family protein [Chloroflexota bacterium]